MMRVSLSVQDNEAHNAHQLIKTGKRDMHTREAEDAPKYAAAEDCDNPLREPSAALEAFACTTFLVER